MSMLVSRQTAVLAIAVGAALISGCATRKQLLSDADRASLRSQPVISVVHYVTPLP